MITRRIPRTGEEVPVIGLGTWQTFDVAGRAAIHDVSKVLDAFASAGGRVVDTSPMYGRSEQVLGEARSMLHRDELFLATKVWTSGRTAGEEQMRRSMRLIGADRLDLIQVHNLLDVHTHLETLNRWKAEGLVRYVGITHYVPSALMEMEKIVRSGAVDFVQIPYSAAVRDAERTFFDTAAECQVAVLVNRPFEEGEIFRAVRNKPLPEWAAEIACVTWAELFLKFIVAHPAVTSVLPATKDLSHLAANLRAGEHPLPDLELRRRIAALV